MGVHVVESRSLQRLFTILRDHRTPHKAFVDVAGRLSRLLLEDALCCLPMAKETVPTPCGSYDGVVLPDMTTDICCVSIIRAGMPSPAAPAEGSHDI